MLSTDKNGTTTREHLEQVGRQTGRMPDEYYGPELPELLESTWGMFLEINTGRQQGPLSFEGIKAYCDLTGQVIYNWQLDAIKRLDIIWMRKK